MARKEPWAGRPLELSGSLESAGSESLGQGGGAGGGAGGGGRKAFVAVLGTLIS